MSIDIYPPSKTFDQLRKILDLIYQLKSDTFNPNLIVIKMYQKLIPAMNLFL